MTTPKEEVSRFATGTPQAVAPPRTTLTPQAWKPRHASVREGEEALPRTRPVPLRDVSYPDEKMTTVLSLLREMNHSLAGFRETVAALSREVRETGKQQADTMKMLRDLSVTIAQKKKDTWWSRLFSR